MLLKKRFEMRTSETMDEVAIVRDLKKSKRSNSNNSIASSMTAMDNTISSALTDNYQDQIKNTQSMILKKGRQSKNVEAADELQKQFKTIF
jgi:predicted transcriptional regulator